MLGSIAEVEHALASGAVTLHAKVKGRYHAVDADGNEVIEVHETTPGRLLLGELLPRKPGVKFALVNQLLTKKNISGLIDAVYRNCGQKETVIFCDRIMGLGFYHAFKAGISFGKDDMVIPDTKVKIVEADPRARARVRAAVQRRPHHPAGEVQQGGGRLVQVHRPDRQGDDGSHLHGAARRQGRRTSRSTRST